MGSMNLGIDEVPMYSSVGSSENNGNMIQMVWELSNGLATPYLNEHTTMNINNITTQMTVAVAQGEAAEDGQIRCPSEMKWKPEDSDSHLDFTCIEDEDCVDQVDSCPVIGPKNQCQSLSKICCKTCTIYLESMAKTTASPTNETDVSNFQASNSTVRVQDVEEIETTDTPVSPTQKGENVTTGTSSTTTAGRPTTATPTPSGASTPAIFLGLFLCIFL